MCFKFKVKANMYHVILYINPFFIVTYKAVCIGYLYIMALDETYQNCVKLNVNQFFF